MDVNPMILGKKNKKVGGGEGGFLPAFLMVNKHTRLTRVEKPQLMMMAVSLL